VTRLDELGHHTQISIPQIRQPTDLHETEADWALEFVLLQPGGKECMGSRKVRAVVTTKFGCWERTAWHPEGSAEGTDAMHTLVDRQTEMFCLSWEHLEDEAESADAGN